MMVNKPETALNRTPTFFPLLAPRGGISACGMYSEREYHIRLNFRGSKLSRIAASKNLLNKFRGFAIYCGVRPTCQKCS